MAPVPRFTQRITPETIRMSSHTMTFDPSKAIRELGFPQTPGREAPAETVEGFRENGYTE